MFDELIEELTEIIWASRLAEQRWYRKHPKIPYDLRDTIDSVVSK